VPKAVSGALKLSETATTDDVVGSINKLTEDAPEIVKLRGELDSTNSELKDLRDERKAEKVEGQLLKLRQSGRIGKTGEDVESARMMLSDDFDRGVKITNAWPVRFPVGSKLELSEVESNPITLSAEDRDAIKGMGMNPDDPEVAKDYLKEKGGE